MKINKDNAMLVDIKYVRPDRFNNLPDYLYIIWKDLDTNEKHLQIVEEPKMEIYFEKPEFRDHAYNKNYARLEELDKKVVKYKDIIYVYTKLLYRNLHRIHKDICKIRLILYNYLW